MALMVSEEKLRGLISEALYIAWGDGRYGEGPWIEQAVERIITECRKSS